MNGVPPQMNPVAVRPPTAALPGAPPAPGGSSRTERPSRGPVRPQRTQQYAALFPAGLGVVPATPPPPYPGTAPAHANPLAGHALAPGPNQGLVQGFVQGVDDPMRELVLVADVHSYSQEQLAALARRAADTDHLEEVTAEEMGLASGRAAAGGRAARSLNDHKQPVTLDISDSDDFGGKLQRAAPKPTHTIHRAPRMRGLSRRGAVPRLPRNIFGPNSFLSVQRVRCWAAWPAFAERAPLCRGRAPACGCTWTTATPRRRRPRSMRAVPAPRLPCRQRPSSSRP